MYFSPVAIIATVLLAAAISRFLRRASLTAGLREGLSQRSRLLCKLFSCSHCLCFWVSVACAAFLAHSRWEAAVLVLLGWRGGYHLNSLTDALARRARPRVAPERACRVCGTPWKRGFLERQGMAFCSFHCWVDYLKESRLESRQRERQVFDAGGALVKEEIYPMSYAEVDVVQAKELLDNGQGYTYVDVRSEPEFDSGRPAGAVNIPLLHRRGAGMVPNPDFVRVVEANFPHDARLLIGCQAGGRSLQAARALLAAGFINVSNVNGGFGGQRDASGRVTARGWLESGLPVEHGEDPERSYAALTCGPRR
ncbi:MAG: rhodanese-like domain-containing protein [Candidatus Latescibacterota bacterium]